ncbi:hypothetical protein [Pyxidicoccus caerfyrddinensis]|uniref:hypothetical protein n=1 Tax=Pyxidicoccus caerfyrddinensis TaxID=2709663 RepID=UPI0013DA6382|nr:hypothetical protein [Pyxidicoccus caerfyrddinensis]
MSILDRQKSLKRPSDDAALEKKQPPRKRLRAPRAIPFGGEREPHPLVEEIKESFTEGPPVVVAPCPLRKDPPPQSPVKGRGKLQYYPLYAFLTKFEPGPDMTTTDVVFECVPMPWFHLYADVDPAEFWEQHGDYPAPRIQLTGLPCVWGDDSVSVDLKPLKHGKALVEDTWYRLLVVVEEVDSPSLPAWYDDFYAPDDPARRCYILHFDDLLDPKVHGALLEKFAERPGAVEPQIGSTNAVVGYVAALPVGQGGLNALFSPDGRPFLYHDLGRSKWTPERPPNPARIACMGGNPTVVLSHWDEDHFELPVTFEPACDLPWVYPSKVGEAMGTRRAKISNRLSHRRMWDHAHMRFEEYSWGFIVKCDGATVGTDWKNNSGLAVLARVQDDDRAPPVGQRRALDAAGARPELFPDERYVVLTGDAMCSYIPSCREGDLDGKVVALLASHHGAQTHMQGQEAAAAFFAIPKPAPLFNGMPPAIVYTYGVDNADNVHQYHSFNMYGHPGRLAVNLYARRGYHHRLNTATRTGDVANHYANHRASILATRLQGAPHPPGSVQDIAARQARSRYLELLDSAAYTEALRDYECEAIGFRAAANAGNNYSVAAQNAYTPYAVARGVPLAVRNAYTFGPILAAAWLTKIPALTALLNSLLDRIAVLDVLVDEAQRLARQVALTAPRLPVPHQVLCGPGALGLVPAAAVVGNPVDNAANPPTTVARGVPDAVQNSAFNNEPVKIVAVAANRIVVLHTAHGLATNDVVSFGEAPGGLVDGSSHAITKLDADHYHIAAGGAAALIGGAARVATKAATILETAPDHEIVWHPNHGQVDGATVQLGRAGLPAAQRIRKLDADHYAVDRLPVPVQATAVTKVSVGGTPVSVITTAANQTMVRQRLHHVINGARISFVDASGPWNNLNNAFGVPRNVAAVLDEDHYTVGFTRGAVDVGLEACQCGTQVVLYSAAANKAVVSHRNHGKVTGNNVTISDSGLPACNGVQAITKLDVNHYSIAGPAVQANHVGTAAIADASSAELITVAAGRILVRQAGHGNPANRTFAGGILNGRTEAVTIVDADHYTVPVEASARWIYDGTVTADLNPVVTLKTFTGNFIIRHVNHGYVTGNNVTFANGLLNGATLQLTVIDADHYAVITALASNEDYVDATVTANTHACIALRTAPGSYLIRDAGHGRATGDVLTFVGWLGGRDAPITVLTLDYYSIPFVPESGWLFDAGITANGNPTVVLKNSAHRTIVREPGHNRANGSSVTIRTGVLAGRTYRVYAINADYYAIAEGITRTSRLYSGTAGVTPVELITVAQDRVLVRQAGHGNPANRTFAGAYLDNRTDAITVVDADHYTVPVESPTTFLRDAAVTANLAPVVALKTAHNAFLIHQANHGHANNTNVTFANGPLGGRTLPITKLAADLYAVYPGLGAGGDSADATVTAGGQPVIAFRSAPDSILIGHANHGFNTGTVVQFAGGCVGARPAAVTKLSADFYSIPVVSQGGVMFHGGILANGNATVVLKNDATRTIVREVGHNRANGSQVTFRHGALAGQSFAITVLSPDYYAITLAAANATAFSAQQRGTSEVRLYQAGLGEALVRRANHGYANGDRVVVGGSAAGTNDGLHEVTRLDADHFGIPTRLGRTSCDTTARVGNAVVRVVRAPINERVVLHPNHGLAVGANITISNAAEGALNGAAVILHGNENAYRVAAGNAGACAVDLTGKVTGSRKGTRTPANGALPGPNGHTVPTALIRGTKSKEFCDGDKLAKAARVLAADVDYNTQLAACKAGANHCTTVNGNLAGVAFRGLTHRQPP